ncbi:MAG: hypothetical protein Q7R70_05220 [Candidatus Diapherotrites archaeon]|nr:hypothetical protein [Candidatus Diapherotrites archaeon]
MIARRPKIRKPIPFSINPEIVAKYKKLQAEIEVNPKARIVGAKKRRW